MPLFIPVGVEKSMREFLPLLLLSMLMTLHPIMVLVFLGIGVFATTWIALFILTAFLNIRFVVLRLTMLSAIGVLLDARVKLVECMVHLLTVSPVNGETLTLVIVLLVKGRLAVRYMGSLMRLAGVMRDRITDRVLLSGTSPLATRILQRYGV